MIFGSKEAIEQIKRDLRASAMMDVGNALQTAVEANAVAGNDPEEFARAVVSTITNQWDTWDLSKFLNELYEQLIGTGVLLPDKHHRDLDTLGAIAELINNWQNKR